MQWQPQQPWHDNGQYQPMPPLPQPARRSRALLYAGIAALVVLAGGGAAYALTSSGSPAGPGALQAAANPGSCKQQYSAWKNGPAHAIGEQVEADAKKLTSAGNSEDIPAALAALKAVGADAGQLEQDPMPACADPARYWEQYLADLKAAGDNAGTATGLGGLLVAEGPMKNAVSVQNKLTTELARTAGVKSTP